MEPFTLHVTYSQVAVFGTKLAQPFNDWTDVHVKQGFAWRPGSVSFATLEDGGQMRIRVSSAMYDEASSRASRVIRVPFTVPGYGEVDVASIGDAVTLKVPPGDYDLVFEHGKDEAEMWANLHFVRASKDVTPAILRADAELSPPTDLLMSAQPA